MAVLLLLGTSCSKSNDVNDGATPRGITASINGAPFRAFQSAAGFYANYYAVGGAGMVSGDSVFLTVYVATPVAPGQQISTDDNGFAEIDYVIHRNNIPFASYSAYQGQKGPAYYTVTAIDTIKRTIRGTFSGALTRNGWVDGAPDSIVVTNGAFNTSF